MEFSVENLCKSYDGVPVLRNVSLTVPPGITVLTAPSGSGKTTLLRILLGLERADSGRVRGLERARLAAVFQENRLLEGLNAAENLRFVLGGGLEAQSAQTLLMELDLAWESRKPVGEYSGGMKRRLALARALLAPSDALVLDEPFTGLDEENRGRAFAAIRRHAAEKPVLLVSHVLPTEPGVRVMTLTQSAI